jgi:signal transduction histidine kinase
MAKNGGRCHRMGIVSLFTQLLDAFSTPDGRGEAATRLASLIGSDRVILFTRDASSESFVPITPFDHRSAGAADWFRATAIAGAEHGSSILLPHPETGRPVPVLLQQAADGSVLAAVGGTPRRARVKWAVRALPIMSRMVRAERVEALEAQSREAKARAAEASRLKDEFLATLSHELRTPLNAMIGWIQMLRLHQDDVALRERALEVIERNARMQTQVVADLLDVSRIIRGKLRLRRARVDLAAVVQAGCESLRPSIAARNLRLAIDVAPMLCVVHGDADRLQQVVWNLVSNASKFTAPGGRIDVRVNMSGSSASITVSDNGMGIDPAFVPYVFDRFRQEDSTITRAHGGLGLGLAIVRHLVELHGGSVDASSGGEGKGATFTVRIPCSPPEPTPHACDLRTQCPD